MRLSRFFLGIDVADLAKLRALVGIGHPDPVALCLLFQKHHAQLTPREHVQAASLFRKLASSPETANSVSINLPQLQAAIASDIRAKLYALTDPTELCDVLTGLLQHGITCKGLVSDFVTRLESTLSSLRGASLSHVCNSIVHWHECGHRVIPLCSKLLAHLAARSRDAEYTLENCVALVRCLTSLGLRHKQLEKAVGKELMCILTSSGVISEENLISLLRYYKNELRDSYYVRLKLVDAALKREKVSLELLEGCLNVGQLPSKQLGILNGLVPEALGHGCSNTVLGILKGYCDLRYKPTEAIGPILSIIKNYITEIQDSRDLAELCRYLYRLDLKEDALLVHATEHIEKNGELGSLTPEQICNLLQAACYFGMEDPHVYDKILTELMRIESLHRAGDLRNAQMIAAYLCHSMKPVTKRLSIPVRAFLDELVRKRTSEPLDLRSSELQEEVGKTATFISYSHYQEVQVGPYLVDFVRKVTNEEIGDMRQRDNRFHRLRHFSQEQNLGTELRDSAIIIMAYNRSNFYRKTKESISESRFHLRVLESLGYRCVTVPYWEWEELSSWYRKRSYLQGLLEGHEPRMLMNRSSPGKT